MNEFCGRRWRRGAAAAVLAIGANTSAGCDVGNGSDIGPKLPRLPDASCKVVVLDDQGRGVVGATVTAGNARALSGRNGRGDFLASPRGRVLVTVAAEDAAAAAADSLGGYRVALTIVGPDVPEVLHVPDRPLAATATVLAGTQAAPTVIPSTAGALLTIPAGSSVGTAGGAAEAIVRVGDLQAVHLPGDLPLPASGTWLFGRGLAVDTAGASFTPPADLDLADDLGLGAGNAQLFRLDQDSGEWIATAVTGAATGGRIVATAAVAGSGIYVFATPVAAALVRGRVVDAAGLGVPDALVRVDARKALTDGSGRFAIGGVAAALADGSGRSAAIEWLGGGSWLPVRAATTLALAGTEADAGDLVLDTLLAGNIRTQNVLQGRADPLRPARLSALRGAVALATTTDANGRAFFEDVPAEYFGFQDGRALDTRDVVYGQSIGFLERGRRWLDSYQFFQRRTWYEGGRRSRTLVCDALGGGPLENAWVVQGATAGQGSAGETREGGTLFITRDFAGRATATLRTERDGRVVVSGYSIVVPNGEHLELPLHRVLRTPLGAFDRHGLVDGSLIGADGSRQHELRATRRLSAQEWWDELVEGAPAPSAVPVDVDPATTHAEFVVGVPTPGGNVAAAEFTAPGGVKTLQKVGVLADVVPIEGGRTLLDLPLDAAATTPFVVPGALATLPAEFDLGRLTVALALQQPSARIVDVVRGLAGNHAAAGADLQLTLPPLTGAFADHGWLALCDMANPGVGGDVRSTTLLTLPRTGAALPAIPLGAATFREFPQISAPANGATVPASGFTVQFTLPPGALYGAIDLTSASGGETLRWRVIVPPASTQFAFVTLPIDVPSPLIAGRAYSLAVSAYFGDGVVTTLGDPYGNLATFVQSIGAVELGVSQVTRRTIAITAN